MNYYQITLCLMILMVRYVQPAPYDFICRRGYENSGECQTWMNFYKNAFFRDVYGNVKDNLTFNDYLNHYKAAGYGFSKEQAAGEAKIFYSYANGLGYRSLCLFCGNGDGKMNLHELLKMHTSNDTARIERQFDLMDKNEDGLVTLLELRKFNVAVYKDLMLTQDEFRMQNWMLRNLYSKDLLGSDDAFDREEFMKMQRSETTTPATPLATTLKPEIFSKKPFEFWDLNKDDIISYEELYRFKQK